MAIEDKSKGEILNRVYNLAFKYEASYGSCPQAILRAICEVFQIKNMDIVIKVSHALAGGLGLSGNGSCGALVGGVMALSFFYGRELKDMDKGRFLKSYIMAKKLYDRFVEEFGSCICKDVQNKIFGRSFNLWDPEEYKEFERMGGHRDKCPEVSGKVARWVAEMLLKDKTINKNGVVNCID
ncbi:MAG: C-GCAxxG-C-C family protein [Candidatus Methanomethylicia archaeon]